MEVIDARMRIAGVNDMLKRLCNSERLPFRLTVFIPVVPAPNGHKTTGVERSDVRIIRVLLVEFAHLG